MQADTIGLWGLALPIITVGTAITLTLACANGMKPKKPSSGQNMAESKTQSSTPRQPAVKQKPEGNRLQRLFRESRTNTTSGEKTSHQERAPEVSFQQTTESSYGAEEKQPPLPPGTKIIYPPKFTDRATAPKIEAEFEAPVSAGMELSMPVESVKVPEPKEAIKATTELKEGTAGTKEVTAKDKTKDKSKPLSAMNPASTKDGNDGAVSNTYANIPEINTVTKGPETLAKLAQITTTDANTKLPTATNRATCLKDPTASVDPEEQFKVQPRKHPVGELKPRKFRKEEKARKIEAGMCKPAKEYPTMDDVMSDWESDKAVTAPSEPIEGQCELIKAKAK
uniref:Uncharacterized protein n=1 Tax=Panagrellus redivivus TaxID=6233 RepID=A0A7E4VIM2_PANRE